MDELAETLADADLAYGPVLAASELQRERAERKLSDADRVIAKLAALHSDSHSLSDRVAVLETEAARDARAIEAMRNERKALVARGHARELELQERGRTSALRGDLVLQMEIGQADAGTAARERAEDE